MTVPLEEPVIGVGDDPSKKQAEKLAALSAVYQLHGLGLVRHLPTFLVKYFLCLLKVLAR